ncbi:sialate O-acetylesterase [Cellulophaga omnivescoria]|uniref:sialate O-acetylesterase n=1 Tax=Cellulophaga omnivescoria TaxID=1888890 RepID=UPI000985E689|nr:sialate O-acetylesterase [Cellulophaga omnivescoria]WBU90882.1 sialate O-acetylesterase [Cellulophaga omnivescoria]WKB83017.1 sialate O-acetylesterase [Cellulophaga lytica]
MKFTFIKYIALTAFMFTFYKVFLPASSTSTTFNTKNTTHTTESNTIDFNPNFHIYICFGQSNMEGSATIEDQDLLENSRFKVLQSLDCDNLKRKKGEWYTAVAPLSQCYAGLSPADYFGKTMANNLPDSITVGVVNVAVGGSDIRLFDKDIYSNYLNTYKEDWFTDKINAYSGNPYNHLIQLAKQAQKQGVIKGILLHQGESNTGDKKWPTYVRTVYNNMLADLSLKEEEVPLLAGEMVHEQQGGKCESMNPIVNTLPSVVPTAHIISSKGCEVRTDSVHFNSEGVRELGKRYALKILELKYK